jgi:hypothetical protein
MLSEYADAVEKRARWPLLSRLSRSSKWANALSQGKASARAYPLMNVVCLHYSTSERRGKAVLLW